MTRKITHDEYVEQVKALGTGITVVGTYVNIRTKITHRCKEGHEWDITPNNLKKAKGCPHCSGHIPQDYHEWLDDDGRGIIALEPYVNSYTKITHRCKEGHEWDVRPNNLKRGKGCPYCSGRVQQDYSEWLKENSPNIVALQPYVNAKTKIKHKCKEGHEWSASPNKIKNGRGCPYCSGQIPQDYNGWLKQNRPDIVALQPYKKAMTKITHRCKEGHEWEVVPNDIKNGRGCPHCSGRIPQDYHEWLKEDGRGIIALEPYVNNHTKIKHKCGNCKHEWGVLPATIKRGSGCPKCAPIYTDNDCVYIWQLKGERHLGCKVYKVGITSHRLEDQRIKDVAKGFGVDYNIIKLAKVKDAKAIETKLLTLGFPVVGHYSGYAGGGTEIVAMTDYELALGVQLIEEGELNNEKGHTL